MNRQVVFIFVLDGIAGMVIYNVLLTVDHLYIFDAAYPDVSNFTGIDLKKLPLIRLRALVVSVAFTVAEIEYNLDVSFIVPVSFRKIVSPALKMVSFRCDILSLAVKIFDVV